MRFLFVGALTSAALVVVGCDKDLPVEATCTRIDAAGAVVHVTSEPGATITIDRATATATEDGTAELVVALDEFSYQDMRSATIEASAEGLLGARYGQVQLQLPMTPNEAKDIPAVGEALFLRLSGGAPAEGRLGPILHGVIASERVRAGDGTVRIGGSDTFVFSVRSRPNASVEVDGHTVETDSGGTGRVEIPSIELLRRLPSAALTSNEPTVTLLVSAELDEERFDEAVAFQLFGVNRALDVLASDGSLVRGPGRSPALSLLYVGEDGPWWLGQPGRLGDADIVAVGHPQPGRAGPPCTGYGASVVHGGSDVIERAFVDVEISVVAANGTDLRHLIVQGGGDGCPRSVRSRSTILDGPGRPRILSALRPLLSDAPD
ncbi:MAG: hypothetical protein AAGF12_00160 [Myxococcota bacterium]